METFWMLAGAGVLVFLFCAGIGAMCYLIGKNEGDSVSPLQQLYKGDVWCSSETKETSDEKENNENLMS